MVLYIIAIICPMTIIIKYINNQLYLLLILKKMIISPCISICKTDPQTGYCYGCGRDNEEKKMWKEENTSNQWKNDNLINIQKRLSGWQLESFKESYKHKTENGISLFKKKLING
jgi:uncharacterized protein